MTLSKKRLHPNSDHTATLEATTELPVDTIDEGIVMVPQAQVEAGLKEPSSKDGSRYFQLFGGPYHDKTVRIYPPYTHIRFPDVGTYTIHPPLSKSGQWLYVYETEATK